MIELNITPTIFKPDTSCFEWCKDAHFAHAQNIFVGDLYIIFAALLSLGIYKFISGYDYWLIEKGIHEDYLNTAKVLSISFAFYMMVIFIIYIIYFK